MWLSATKLGEKCGLTGEQFNYVLKDKGYIDGMPGEYYPTEKGMWFIIEKGWDNGCGGYCARGYNYFQWNDDILNYLDLTDEYKAEVREKVSIQRRQRREARQATSKAYWERRNNNSEDSKNYNDKEVDRYGAKILAKIIVFIIEEVYACVDIYRKNKITK